MRPLAGSGRRRWVAVAVAGVLLLAVPVAAEVATRSVAEGRVRAEVDHVLGSHGCSNDGVEASIGAPASWQLVRGTLEQVDVAIDGLGLRDMTPDVRVTMSDLDVRGRTADRVDAAAVVGWADLTRQLRATSPAAADVDARFVGMRDGRAAIAAEVPTALGTVALEALVDLQADGGELTGEVGDVSIDGITIPADLVTLMAPDEVQELMSVRQSVPMPDGFELTSAEVGSDGVTVNARGSRVDLEGLVLPPCA